LLIGYWHYPTHLARFGLDQLATPILKFENIFIPFVCLGYLFGLGSSFFKNLRALPSDNNSAHRKGYTNVNAPILKYLILHNIIVTWEF